MFEDILKSIMEFKKSDKLESFLNELKNCDVPISEYLKVPKEILEQELKSP